MAEKRKTMKNCRNSFFVIIYLWVSKKRACFFILSSLILQYRLNLLKYSSVMKSMIFYFAANTENTNNIHDRPRKVEIFNIKRLLHKVYYVEINVYVYLFVDVYILTTMK